MQTVNWEEIKNSPLEGHRQMNLLRMPVVFNLGYAYIRGHSETFQGLRENILQDT
jgi:hypothetical protein